MIDERKMISFINSKEFQIRTIRSSKSIQEVLLEFVEEQPKIGGWIPCSERLPDEDGTYLVTRPNCGNWFTETMYFCRGSFTDKYVIAWQPLPAPYTETLKD